MESKEAVRVFLLEYIKKQPQLELTDLIKLLYQSAFGCGHFAPDEARVLEYLEIEMETMRADRNAPLDENVLGGYARVNIAPYAARGMETKTLARLFMKTANAPLEGERKAWFDEMLSLLGEMAQAGELPFAQEDVCAELAAYREAGCPSVHHSKRFRAAAHPAYRILRAEYAQLLPVFDKIDRLLERRERVLIAIDGSSGSGKSTLAQLLKDVYGATLVHMDDFFLQMHQRTKERFETPGGNVDHERFFEEVLLPMSRGETFLYRPFDCSRMAVGKGTEIAPGKLCIVEGSYSLHPALESEYDLKIVLSISPAAQAERILKRNGPQMLGRFMNEWIPMENLYFEATRIKDRCDMGIGVTPEQDGVRYDVHEREAEHERRCD